MKTAMTMARPTAPFSPDTTYQQSNSSARHPARGSQHDHLEDSDYEPFAKKPLGKSPPNTIKKRAGRKLATDEPVNRRIAQNRIAQRTFREKRENYVHGLEEKIKQLSLYIESHGLPLPPALSLSASSSPSPDSLNPADSDCLREKVANLEQENALLRELTFSMAVKPELPQYNSPPTFVVAPSYTPLSMDSGAGGGGLFTSDPEAFTPFLSGSLGSSLASPTIPFQCEPLGYNLFAELEASLLMQRPRT
ncbi:hypothetical protein BJ741DRAFT_167111 [Chytriomyces cf. hyalinus JEL632]|nr:hypothetical protein BJ741DRAFT_167111 [Chytriomyces cf. hyalinus JEL632]